MPFENTTECEQVEPLYIRWMNYSSIKMLNKFTILIKPAGCNSKTDNSVRQAGDYVYSPCDQIGLGFVSKVYLGRQKQTNKPVAIKIINTAEQDALGMQLLQGEIKALETIKKFKCKNLLLLEAHFSHQDKLHIVTEYCEMKDIAKLLREHKQFNQTQAQTIMKQILQAYAEVYILKMVHRDLKLSNLLLTNGKVKLADFGFSVQVGSCSDQFAYNVGSPHFMAPQSLRRNRYGFKSDIWALGVIAYQLIYGQLPFREKVDSLQYQKIMSTSIQDIFANKTQPSQTYKSFIIECMQIDLQKRATPQFVINYYWPQAHSSLSNLLRQEKNNIDTNLKQTNLPTQYLRPVATQTNTLTSSNQKRMPIEFTKKEFKRRREQQNLCQQQRKKLQQQGKKLQQQVKKLQQQGNGLQQLGNGLQQLGNGLQQVGNGLQQVGNGLQQLGKKLKQQQSNKAQQQQRKTQQIDHKERLSSSDKNHEHSVIHFPKVKPSIRSLSSHESKKMHHKHVNSLDLNVSFQEILSRTQALVQNQINFCTFLYKLVLFVDSSHLAQGADLCRYFSHKITNILGGLVTLTNGAPNQLSNSFMGHQIMINQAYAKIRRDVELNIASYQSKLHSYKDTVAWDGVLLRSIRNMNESVRRNYKTLFWLCEQFELQQMERKNNAEYFLHHSNINQLSNLDLGKQIEVSQNQILRLQARVKLICSTPVK